MRSTSIRLKITVLYVMILGAILVIYSAVLYTSLYFTLFDEVNGELITKSDEIARMIESYLDMFGRDKLSFTMAAGKTLNPPYENQDENSRIDQIELQWLQKVDKLNLKEDFVALLDPGLNITASSQNFPQDLALPAAGIRKASGAGRPFFWNMTWQGNRLRGVCVPFYGEKKRMIAVLTSLKPEIHLLVSRLRNIAISIPVILAAAWFVGQVFASRILQPVFSIAQTANNITHENLNARVRIEHLDFEMKYLADAFNNMISRLEESFKYIAEFSSYVSHELKTPLAVIKTGAELALRKDRDYEEYRKVIALNIEEVDKMLRTIDDVLLMARLDYRRDVLKSADVNINALIKEIYEQAKLLIADTGIHLELSMPDSPLFVKGDMLHLHRLFLNLVDNAIKFTPENGRITVTLNADGKRAVVKVTDTGRGIREPYLHKVFEKFFRADSDGTQKRQGSGLGLYIAQSIAKMHDGIIRVESEMGKGTTFEVELPLAS